MAQVKFCTYFDHHYLDRGLVLYESLRRHFPGAVLHVLALSETCEEFLRKLALDGLVVVSLSKILNDEPRLVDARKSRSATEFIFTLTPYIVCDTLNEIEEGGQVIYLDADMMFIGSPAGILRESETYDVAITPHNFSPHMEGQKRFGIYNVGWVGFKKSAGGIRCAKWWAESCLEWCHDRLENGKFADQKYLENFENIADSVHVIKDIGLNAAPWNVSGRWFAKSGDEVLVDGMPLVLYHFAKVKRITPWCIATRVKQQAVVGAKKLNAIVYREYAKRLEEVTQKFSLPAEWLFNRKNQRHGSKYKSFERDDNPNALQVLARCLRGEYAISNFWKILVSENDAAEKISQI